MDPPNWVNFQSYNNEVGKLFNNPLLADIKFEFADQIIYAHSFVLAMRGKGFYDSFKDSIGIMKLVPISDISYDAFYNFLRCLYKLENFAMTDTNYWEYLKIVSRYEVKDMEQKCYKLIERNMSISSVCSILQYTIDVETIDKNVQVTALNFIDYNLKEILKNDSFYKININTLHKILEWPYGHSGATEMDIFKAVMKWAGLECDKQQLQSCAPAKRSILGDTLKLIRFPSMTSDEFSECIQMEPDLFEEREVYAIFHNISTKQGNNLGFLDYKRTNVSKSQCLMLTSLQPNIVLPPTTKFSTQFTVTQSIRFTGISHTSPGGDGTLRIISCENNEQLYSKSWINGPNRVCVRSINPAVIMKSGKRYEILFEFGNSAESCKGFKTDYDVPLKLNGRDNLIFYLTKVAPNINNMYYDREEGSFTPKNVFNFFNF